MNKADIFLSALQEFDPAYYNGAVVLHFDKQTERLHSISPMIPATSIQELYLKLHDARDAITNVLNDLINS